MNTGLCGRIIGVCSTVVSLGMVFGEDTILYKFSELIPEGRVITIYNIYNNVTTSIYNNGKHLLYLLHLLMLMVKYFWQLDTIASFSNLRQHII